MFSYLDETNIFERYKAAKRYTDSLTVPFPEFERIARNRPFEGIDPNYPNTTDGTTASIIRKTPRRVIQQLPTGKVENDAEDWLSVVADFIYTNKILPYANEDYDLLTKCWSLVEAGLTFGFGATYTPFLNHEGYFCPDVVPIYWGDIAVQPGKKSLAACSYVFVRSWWQKEDIEALIDKETKLAASAKKRGEKYDSSWDLKALAEIKDTKSTKDQQARTPHEDERSVDASAIELVTGFQKGVGAEFITFGTKGNLIVRTQTNDDPRGKYPIDALYGDVDGSNPFGRGIVELVGGLQNLIDSDMQMYQYNRALMLAPPVVVTGNVSTSKVNLVPNAVIKITDPNGKVVPLEIDTTAVTNYPALYGLQKSQLLNLVNSPDTSISSDVGNPGFSKTPAGINQQKATISVDDNYVRKMFESWFEAWSETAINMYFAKRSGIEVLQLDDDTADQLRKLAKEGKFDESQLNEDNEIRIDYDTATPALTFRVDASTSKMKDDADQLQALVGLLNEVGQSQLLSTLMGQYPDKLIGVYNRIVTNSGVEDPEKLTISQEETQKMQEMAQTQGQDQGQPPKAPSESLNYKDAPEDIKRQIEAQAGLSPSQMTSPVQQQVDQKGQQLQQQAAPAPQEPPLVQHLRQLGVSDQGIRQVVHHVLTQGAVNGG